MELIIDGDVSQINCVFICSCIIISCTSATVDCAGQLFPNLFIINIMPSQSQKRQQDDGNSTSSTNRPILISVGLQSGARRCGFHSFFRLHVFRTFDVLSLELRTTTTTTNRRCDHVQSTRHKRQRATRIRSNPLHDEFQFQQSSSLVSTHHLGSNCNSCNSMKRCALYQHAMSRQHLSKSCPVYTLLFVLEELYLYLHHYLPYLP